MWRFGKSIGFNTVYVCHNKYFPTELVSSTFGIINFVSHLYSIPAPMAAELEEPFAMLIFLFNCLIAFIASFFLKEMFSKSTPND